VRGSHAGFDFCDGLVDSLDGALALAAWRRTIQQKTKRRPEDRRFELLCYR
jgi:hypothetical protein